MPEAQVVPGMEKKAFDVTPGAEHCFQMTHCLYAD